MQKLLRIDIRIISLFGFDSLFVFDFCLGEMQHIKPKGNDNKKYSSKNLWRVINNYVSKMTGDRSHQAKTTKHIQQKTSKKKEISTLKKDKKFKKNKEEKTGGFLVMHSSLASKNTFILSTVIIS